MSSYSSTSSFTFRRTRLMPLLGMGCRGAATFCSLERRASRCTATWRRQAATPSSPVRASPSDSRRIIAGPAVARVDPSGVDRLIGDRRCWSKEEETRVAMTVVAVMMAAPAERL